MTPDDRKRLLADGRARRKAAREPMVPVRVPLEKEIGELVGSYGKYIRRQAEESGVPLEEIERRIARMKEWSAFCLENQNAAAQDAKARELFGPDANELEDKVAGAKCSKCGDRGFFLDREVAARSSRTKRKPTLVAAVTCSCEAGQKKAEHAKTMGRKKPKKRRSRKDEDAELWED